MTYEWPFEAYNYPADVNSHLPYEQRMFIIAQETKFFYNLLQQTN